MILAADDVSEKVVIGILIFLFGMVATELRTYLRAAFHRWRGQAKLKVTFDENQDCQSFYQDQLEQNASGQVVATKSTQIYARIAVTNTNPELAKSCRVYLTNVEFFDDVTKQYERSTYRDSIPLIWSFEPESESLDIPQGIVRHADFLVINSPSGFFSVQLRSSSGRILHPAAYMPLFNDPDLKMRFTLVAAGDDLVPVTIKIEKEPGLDWRPKLKQIG